MRRIYTVILKRLLRLKPYDRKSKSKRKLAIEYTLHILFTSEKFSSANLQDAPMITKEVIAFKFIMTNSPRIKNIQARVILE